MLNTNYNYHRELCKAFLEAEVVDDDSENGIPNAFLINPLAQLLDSLMLSPPTQLFEVLSVTNRILFYAAEHVEVPNEIFDRLCTFLFEPVQVQFKHEVFIMLGHYVKTVHPAVTDLFDLVKRLVDGNPNEELLMEAMKFLVKVVRKTSPSNIGNHQSLWECLCKRILEEEIGSDLERIMAKILLRVIKIDLHKVLGKYREALYAKYCPINSKTHLLESLQVTRKFIKNDDYAIEVCLNKGILDAILPKAYKYKVLRLLSPIMRSRGIYLEAVLSHKIWERIMKILSAKEAVFFQLSASTIVLGACEVASKTQVAKLLESRALYKALKNVYRSDLVGISGPMTVELALRRLGDSLKNNKEAIKCMKIVKKMHERFRNVRGQ